MTTIKMSLTWDAFQKNICHGLSAFQQKGEFVDMTIAADGYFVKVHQLVVSLASSYIKELISSAQSTHPIIFLNKVSYPILCLLLEYVYMGEVLVPEEELEDFVEAAKSLHIKGLENMIVQNQNMNTDTTQMSNEMVDELVDKRQCLQQHTNTKTTNKSGDNSHHLEDQLIAESLNCDDDCIEVNDTTLKSKDISEKTSRKKNILPTDAISLQYTTSNQGSPQLILNRFIYYLRSIKTKNSSHRLWRCVDYIKQKCPAYVITNKDGNNVLQRSYTHSHSFHDKKILKKVRDNKIFSASHYLKSVNDSKSMDEIPNLQ